MQYRKRHTPALIACYGLGIPLGRKSGASNSVKGIALLSDIKVFALINTGKIKGNEKTLYGLTYNFEV